MTSSKTTGIPIRLVRRDLDIFGDAYRFRALLRGQIHRLHFPCADVRRCNRRLKKHADAGFLIAEPLPLGPVSRMASGEALSVGGQFVYRIGSPAVPIVAAHLGIEVTEAKRRVALGTPAFLAHAVEMAEVAINLMRPPYRPGWSRFRCLQYLAECQCTHAFEYRMANRDGSWQTEVLKPDGFALLETDNGILPGFLEVDLGHSSAGAWERKLNIYCRYQSLGLFSARYLHPNFCVLTLTTSDVRARTLGFALRRSPPAYANSSAMDRRESLGFRRLRASA